MSSVELLRENNPLGLGVDGKSFVVSDTPLRLFKAEPAIHDCEERTMGRTVFVVVGDHRIYITPDQATAMGTALIKAAAQERNR